MPQLDRPITEIIKQRFSCRTYRNEPIAEGKQDQLQKFIAALPAGPFGSHPRFLLTAASLKDQATLSGLGTYGFVRNPAGFVIGAISEGEKHLEDFGFLLESTILFATCLGLGTCWLGGSFTRGSFSEKIKLADDEMIPAVTAVGEMADPDKARRGMIRRYVQAENRSPWENLFFDGDFNHPLVESSDDQLYVALDMVRRAPSASNKQPWRVVKAGNAWHFFLQRTPGYRDTLLNRMLDIADLQRVDMGIAMCHFDLTMKELGFPGRWITEEPDIEKLDNLTEYSASWSGV